MNPTGIIKASFSESLLTEEKNSYSSAFFWIAIRFLSVSINTDTDVQLCIWHEITTLEKQDHAILKFP